MSKCPKCDKEIRNATVEFSRFDMSEKRGQLTGMVVTCPHCNVILSAFFDPYALVEMLKQAAK